MYSVSDSHSASHILIVDDDEINRWIAKCLVERLGHQVTTVINGAEALAATMSTSFDLVLMDIEMPVMNGLEATRALRKRERGGAHMPVVALTALGPGSLRRILDAGLDGYLAKPASLEELRKMLESLLPRKERASCG